MLNGKPLNKPWFEHSDLAGGGTLVLVMGPQPNTEWGKAPEAAPPSGRIDSATRWSLPALLTLAERTR
jgi:putative alpha-1,2-mannosidase